MKSLFPEQRELDVVLIGRIGVDLNANEIHRPMEETETFTKYVGGSAANTAIGLSRLGKKVGFITRVSDDQFGRFAVNYFKKEDIDTSSIIVDPNARMGLAFTEIKSPTESSILMYRDNAADLKCEPVDVKEDYIKKARTLIVSGTALASSPAREAVFVAMEYAKKYNTTIIFDVDYRPYTWKDKIETAIYYSMVGMMSDIIIGSREEFDLLEQIIDPDNTSDEVTANRWFGHGCKVCVIKHGKDGSTAYTPDGAHYKIKSFPVELLKSFGGGDAYASALFYGLLEGWEMIDALEFGSASAAMLVASHSCSDAMPTVDAIKEFIKEKKEQYGEMVARA